MSKIRNGFVTNSSSSSFIVAFNEIPKTIMDVRRELFDDNQMVFAMTYDNEPIGCDDAAQNVFNQMIDKKPNNLKEIKEALQGYLADAPDHYAMTKGFEYGSPEYKEAEAEYDRADKKFRAALLKRFLRDNTDRYIFTFSFSDNDGAIQTALEHEGVFDRVPHITISNH